MSGSSMAPVGNSDSSPKAQEVMEYLTTHELTQRLNDIVNNTVRARAPDPFAFIAEQFLAIAESPVVSHVATCSALDDAGLFNSVNVHLFCRQSSSSYYIASGRNFLNAPVSVDEGAIGTAISNVLKSIPLKAENLSDTDRSLSEIKQDGSQFFIPAASAGFLKAIAQVVRQDPYSVLHNILHPSCSDAIVMPTPLVDIVKSKNLKFNSFGMASTSKLSLRRYLQAVSFVCKEIKSKSIAGASQILLVESKKPDDILTMLGQAITGAQITLGEQAVLWLDAGAGAMFNVETNDYEFNDGACVSREELLALYQTMVAQHPSLAIIIDPFHIDDRQGWTLFDSALGKHVTALSSTLSTVGIPSTVSFRTTVSDFIDISQGAKKTNPCFIASCSHNIRNDDIIVDLAIASGAKYCRFGPITGGTNAELYNRLLWIDNTTQTTK
uniref:phosphopyruvate hydratase n=1 Tax=Spongospora subterranea TaxID=70186 RepID=A0A0H5R9E3_9EUKA|eukprot:CRZ10745.1 hypothetical protein [Spongospora subterranea]